MQSPPISPSALRETGIPGVGPTPWGTHFCQFYATKQDVIDVVVPYLRAGLENNEHCMWVTSPLLEVAEAWDAVAAVVPDLASQRARKRIEIVSHADWYLRDGGLDCHRLLDEWTRKLDWALQSGCSGLRLSGDSIWLEESEWRDFAEYEAVVDRVLHQHRILALCTYSTARCGVAEIADVLKNHQFALLKRHGDWDIIESVDRRRRVAQHATELDSHRARSTTAAPNVGDDAIATDGEGQVLSVGRLRESQARLGLLSRTASRLLATDDPQSVVDDLCREVMQHLGCQVFFNFLVDPVAGGLRLNACAGVPSTNAKLVERLELGAAVCGCAAERGHRVVAEDVQHAPDARAHFVRALGVQAYCCHPLIAEGQLLGTLSFGTTTRLRFTFDEMELMRTVSDQVATAMQRVASKRALSAANEQLRLENDRKSEFLAVLSHELRNPLAPIRNSLYVLGRAEPGSAQAGRALRVVDRQVTQLANLINDLLDITRINRNKIQLQKERVELNQAVRRVIEDNRTLFEDAGVSLELAGTAHPAYIEADSTRLAQIVGNLLQNAAKFARRGGHTRVTVGVSGELATVRVKDDGVGMARETLARLFQPFQQADQTLDRSKGGLGLGLALIKGLVELHGGTIGASSEGLGHGAEFVVSLPLCSGGVSASAPVVDQAHQGRKRVLIIEDNADAADSLREALELGDHEVRVAYDGVAGIELARELEPEVVLCDIGLPGMDGYEVARKLRTDRALGGTVLVALSGYALPEDLARATAAGFDHHLAKPPNIDKLEALLAGLPTGAPARPSRGGELRTSFVCNYGDTPGAAP